MHVGESRDVLGSLDAGALDAAIVLRHDGKRRGGETLFADDFGWMAAPEFAHRPGEPLRLATQSDSCSVRAMGLAALDKAGIAWTEVFIGGGIATIGAAVSAGLAVAALARRVAPPGTVDVGARLGLPALPSRDVMLYATAFDAPSRRALRLLAASFKAAA
jgi:DNA-binding transcriptional LysR family regulator